MASPSKLIKKSFPNERKNYSNKQFQYFLQISKQMKNIPRIILQLKNGKAHISVFFVVADTLFSNH